MSSARSDDLHRTLADRVAHRVEGRGVSHAAVDAAVGSVLAALERAPAVVPARSGTMVAAVTARSMPDLASRLRGALAREGVELGEIGIASSGLHNVATVRVAPSARAQLEKAVAALGASVSVVSDEERR